MKKYYLNKIKFDILKYYLNYLNKAKVINAKNIYITVNPLS